MTMPPLDFDAGFDEPMDPLGGVQGEEALGVACEGGI